ncbi:hypothetical protein [Paenibacillus sp. 1781tsa1]|uniref:hypothetical protein n=1 Tax=Paenibacillus sp. 1781tsa1 TaxID=2953810 RepID=UPI00209E51AC|nr:hypothetical protein [Paenibacillus sp. 1781tsa1]MCP1184909.1 hypothetical protein [Paenibacillus sp. 1781tsa1]
MSKYELSLSKDYVPSWTVVDAVRELFQNALDQQTVKSNNEMFFDYDNQKQVLCIGNKSSILDVRTLLLGSSTKRNDPNTIGQFGEGYKIATLVLTRLEKKVTFYNYGVREVWNPRFVKARRYGGEEILTFFIDKKFIWNKVPDNDLTITIEGITQDEYKEIVDSNLHLQDVGKIIESRLGRVLEEERYRGKVFVNGLFVCDYNEYTQGYDFKPEYINIDRDRKLADSFQLRWLSSKMLKGVDSDRTLDLIKNNAADVQYIASVDGSDKLFDKVYEDFLDENGESAIPVTNQDDYNRISKSATHKPVYVSESYASSIKKSHKYTVPLIKVDLKETINSRLVKWLDLHKQSLSNKAIRQLEEIIDDIAE